MESSEPARFWPDLLVPVTLATSAAQLLQFPSASTLGTPENMKEGGLVYTERYLGSDMAIPVYDEAECDAHLRL